MLRCFSEAIEDGLMRLPDGAFLAVVFGPVFVLGFVLGVVIF